MLPSSARAHIASDRYVTGYNAALVAVMLLAWAVVTWQGFEVPVHLLCVALVAQAVLTGGVWYVQQQARFDESRLSRVALMGSLLTVTLYLYGSGGHTNPMISILLVPLALSAVLLPWRSTLVQAGVVMVAYSLLTRWYVPLQMGGHDGHVHGHGEHEALMSLHLAGMWITFLVSALLICALVIPLAHSVRAQQRLIAKQREKILHDEQLVALATFAASAAHKMGTPLSTLSILVDDLQELVVDQPDWQSDREVMAQQIGLCKRILRDMMQQAESLRRDHSEPLAVAALMASLREQFNLLYPQYALPVANACEESVCVIADATLEQALLNLLDNAVRASDSAPTVSASTDGVAVKIRIEDAGPGFPERIREQFGQPFVPSHHDGLGLGLFLSHSTINRLGGELSLLPSVHGSVLEVSVPVAASQEVNT